MGFRSARDTETATTDRRSQQVDAVRSSPDHESKSLDCFQRMPLEEAEDQYGMSIPDEETLFELQRLEAGNPIAVHEWIEEGMTVEDMGVPQTIDAFRKRQAERPEDVPDDIERRNKRSLQRSEKAASDTGPAGNAGVPGPVRDVIQSNGQPLDDGIQRAMEERMDDSFGNVRIHADATAAKACEEINARAFTVGNHIAFNHGEYDPKSPEGQHILAHELAHVRQQTGADISMMPQDDSGLEIDPDPRLEQEAEDAAQQTMADRPVTINRMGASIRIQRATKGEGMLYEAVEDLQNQVEGIENRQGQIMETILETAPGTSDGFDLSEAAVKGVGGFAAGTAAGSFLGPGAAVTGASGAVAGVASAVAGDVAKETLDTLMSNRPGGEADTIEAMYAEMAQMYEDFLETREDHGGESTGDAQSRGN